EEADDVIVPETPAELIGEFLPKFVGGLLSGPARPAAAGSSESKPGLPSANARAAPASVGVGLRVVGAGEWTLRIVGEQLSSERGIAPDVALQVSLLERDFAA